MQKRRVGKTDIEVSVLGLGTVKIGRNQGVKYPQSFTLPTEQEAAALLKCASDCGINLLDTAPAYGTSEARLGKLLQGMRDNWVICTKAGENFHDGQSSFDFSQQALRMSVENSLKNLRTDYLDILLIHSDGRDQEIIEEYEVFSLLEMLKTEGKIRAYGMSTKTVAGGLLTLEHADLAMITFHADYTDEREVLKKAQALQKGIFVKKALASGHVEDKQAALRFAVNEPGVTSVIIGTLNPENLRQNAAVCA